MTGDTDVTMYTCPVDGCEYSGVKQSVAAHYSGKKPDTGHDGGYEKANQLLQNATDDTEQTAADEQPKPEKATAESQGSNTDESDASDDTAASDGGNVTSDSTFPGDATRDPEAPVTTAADDVDTPDTDDTGESDTAGLTTAGILLLPVSALVYFVLRGNGSNSDETETRPRTF